MKMTRAWQTVGFALVMLLVLGTGWVVEKTIRGPRPHGAATTGEFAKPSEPERPAATDQEYDRSDLLLSQG
jgi:hypothetical protein